MLGGGKPLAELLKNLPKRHFIAKSGEYPWKQVVASVVKLPKADFQDLLERSRKLYARSRADVEQAIQARRPKQAQAAKEALNAWE
jgi:hypothetical protein